MKKRVMKEETNTRILGRVFEYDVTMLKDFVLY